MKRILSILTALVMTFSMAACGAKEAPHKAAMAEESANAVTAAEVRPLSAQIVTASSTAETEDEKPDFDIAEYIREGKYATECFLVITNNTKDTVSISLNGIAKDSNGKDLGSDKLTVKVLGPGETTLESFYFSGAKGVSSVDYTLSHETASIYAPVLSDLSLEKTFNGSNIIVQVKNEGGVPARYVEAHALYFDADDNLIWYSSANLTDIDGEIKPGESVAAQISVNKSFDHAEVILSGYAYEKPDKAKECPVTDDQFEINEYFFEDSVSTHYFITVKNNSSLPVAVWGNAVARDSAGEIVGASGTGIDVVGPGETSIGRFYFSDTRNVASVDYRLQYASDTMYAPVVGNLSVKQTDNGKGVAVSVTNNGDVPALFVQACALFFDAKNNVVDIDSIYIVDDDNEIKPGKTIEKQLESSVSYDYCEVYFVGRYYE